MTTNRTSEAVASLPEWADAMVRACLVTDHPGVDTARALRAIVAKYESYEQLAIEVSAILESPYDEGDLEAVLGNAKRSLAFDPLSDQ